MLDKPLTNMQQACDKPRARFFYENILTCYISDGESEVAKLLRVQSVLDFILFWEKSNLLYTIETICDHVPTVIHLLAKLNLLIEFKSWYIFAL